MRQSRHRFLRVGAARVSREVVQPPVHELERLESRALVSASPPLVTIAPGVAASEQLTRSGTFVVTRAGSTASDLVVNYTVSIEGTAGADDFQPLSGSALIPAGSKRGVISLVPVDDALPEGTETVKLTLTPSDTYTLSSKASRVTTQINVLDNEPIVSVRAGDKTASEGSGNSGTFIISRTGPTNVDLVVNFSLPQDAVGDAIEVDDYQALPATARILAGKKSVTLTVRPVDDQLAEGAERVTFFVEDGAYFLSTTRNAAEILVRDNESVPTATLTVTDALATEHADTGAFGVRLSRAAANDITVYYSIAGTATNDDDYVRIDNFVTIPAGLNFGQIVINPYEEFVAENPETVKLTLGLGPGYNPGQRTTGTVKIFDPASDPVLTDLFSPQTLTTGPDATLPVSVAVFNRGRTPTGEFVVSIYLTSLQNPGAEGYVEYFLGDISYNDGLFPGFEARGTLTTPVVNQPPAGLYRIKIVIDPDNEVTELREDNNTIRSTLLVRVD
jgi:hypothetical protein